MSNTGWISVRVLLVLIGSLGAIYWSPWVPAIAIVLLSLRFRSWEAMLLGFFVDSLWLPSGFPWFTILSVAIVWICEPVRNLLSS